ncbi:MAG TPA: EAL domain-containing protein, partial [Spongiibacteraceae bacterium]|nr:EAL domain-containing protein [Spongiibacteraceae bacterium]
IRHPLADTYLELLRDWSLWQLPFDEAVRTIIAIVGSALNTRRVGLWSYGQQRYNLTMVALFDAQERAYSHGLEITRDTFPIFFAHLDLDRFMAVADVYNDPRTIELAQYEVNPFDITAILNASVRTVGQTWGLLSIEHAGGPRLWSEAEQWFAVSVADLVTQLIAYSEIRDSERRLRFVADNLPIGILKADVEANCVYSNPHWLAMTGLSEANAAGAGWLTAVHAEDRAALRSAVMAVVQAGELSECELRLVARGQTIWITCRWVVERNAEGFPIGALGTFTDIMQERALRENERRYRALFDNSGDAIFLMQDDRFIDCNEQTLEMFGCTREQIIGQPPYRFSPEFQPDGFASKEKALRKIAGAFAGQRQFFEWRHARYDGAVFDAEVTLTCVALSGDPHLLAAVRDISDRKYAELKLTQSYSRLRWINSLATQLNGLRDIYAVGQVSAATLAEHSSAPVARFYRYDEVMREAELIAFSGDVGEYRPGAGNRVRFVLNAATDIVGYIPSVADAALDPRIQQTLLERGVVSIVYIWLAVNDRRLGFVALEYNEPIDFEETQREDLIAASRTIAMALSNVLHIEHMEYQANHDSLTGLPNRNALQRELTRIIGDKTAPLNGLMLLDLDRFKEINDTLGHHVGDKILCQIGPRLRSVLEEDSFLCRLGGDEFAILTAGSEDELIRIARQLLAALKEPFAFEGLKLQIGGSIGIAICAAEDLSGYELLRHADVAMYAAKRGAEVVAYDRQLDQNTPERLALMQELGAGIRDGQLVLHYQPKVELSTARIVGVEALVRWQHPQRGLLPPSVFLPFAELGNTIHALTLNVLEQALEQQQRWLRQGLSLSVAVNLSAHNLMNDECCRQLQELLRRYSPAAGMLELEITETSLMQDPNGAVKVLREFADLGVKFSIDDFGTGYSSLAYLRLLPIHALKIDRAFVVDMIRGEQDAVIVKSIIGLAHNLNLQVIAEGVEDVATLDLLRQLDCDLAQGYYLGRPQSAESLEQLIGATK